jgi:hypothetical protein
MATTSGPDLEGVFVQKAVWEHWVVVHLSGKCQFGVRNSVAETRQIASQCEQRCGIGVVEGGVLLSLAALQLSCDSFQAPRFRLFLVLTYIVHNPNLFALHGPT